MRLIYTFIIIVLANSLSAQHRLSLDMDAIKSAKIFNEAQMNSEFIEMSPAFIVKEIAFVTSNTDAAKDPAIGQKYFDIAYGIKDSLGLLSQLSYFTEEINSPYHEGPLVYDNTESVMYFTRSVFFGTSGDKQDTAKMQIFAATFDEVYPLSFNSKKWNYCHPAINETSDQLILSSNFNEGKKGKYDLFGVDKLGINFGSLSNLGDSINTIYNELYPVFFGNDVLFFSSDRPGGFGGLDIYCCFKRDDQWSQPILLPAPINTVSDDYSLIVDKSSKMGYMSSDREGGKGLDDIYLVKFKNSIFKEEKVKTPVVMNYVDFEVIEKLSFNGLKDVKVTLLRILPGQDNFDLSAYNVDMLPADQKGGIIMKLSPKTEVVDFYTTDENGKCRISIDKNSNYLLNFTKDGYESQQLYYENGTQKKLTIAMEPSTTLIPTKTPNEIIIPTAKGESVVFNNIYYEYNSAKIAKGAAAELDALAKVMFQNPNMKVLLTAYTDARGKAEYNQKLSEQRAESAKNYLVKKGVSPSRIQAQGMGESRIRNHCTDGIKCTEEEHKYNRRTELTIIE
ncbi:MAG: OmpA family protein [Saprospiraceae bacterium]